MPSACAVPPAAAVRPAGRRFTLPELTALIEGAGLRPGDAHGIRIFAGLLPGGAGADPAAAEALRELEEAAASLPAAARHRRPGCTSSAHRA